ncbi:MAG TPA: glycosyltransferase [Steroidobacteraceae bacterium]|nr:glycosyltransferase [Steroidobacteraceae bacterium]
MIRSTAALAAPRTPGSPVAQRHAFPRIEILYLIDYFHRTGGTEMHLAQLIAGLPPEAFGCSVVVFDMGPNALLDGLRARGIPVISLPVGREYVPHAAVQAWRLGRLIRRHRYDIVQTIHQKADTYGALIAWLAGAKCLISSKRDTGELRKPLHVFLNRRLRFLFDAFIAAAEGVRTAVAANDHLPPGRITTIYNGVDTTRFAVPTAAQRADARRALGLTDEDFVAGMVAGFRPEKNHDVFFDGLLRALPAIPSLKVLAVGAGPLLGRYRERIARTALGSRTLFTEDVAEVLPYLWAMDVGCLTPGSNEGFSNAVIEQMAAGLPMIVSDVGGNAEAVIDGVNGRVIPPLDAAAFSAALQALAGDRAHAAAMGRASRARVEERFSVQCMCTEHERLYRALCGRAAT